MYRHQIAKPGSREYVNGQDTCVKCGAVRIAKGQRVNEQRFFMSRGWVLNGTNSYDCPVERRSRESVS